ncbi:MAG: tyrosine-type recombinase/integrase [Sulfuritalea sp.]|nr:tyrosine-type recombinase/integrase [Sulfuritalea sp.]
MARRAKNYELGSKTARLKLEARPKPYYQQIAPGVTLGYIRRDPPPGAWQMRELMDGSYHYRTLGTADDVGTADGRDVLTHAQAVRLAGAPAAPLAGGPITVRRAVENYLTALEGRSNHAREARQRADKHILPTLGRYRVDRLTKRQIEDWLAGMVKAADKDDPDARRRSQDTANRVLTILKAALNDAWADDANSIPSDAAWRRVKPYKDVGGSRVDHFDAKQIRLLIAKAAAEDRRFAELLEAGYLTGARYGELALMDVGDFDAQRSLLVIRKGKTGARPVSLTSEAVQFFKRLSKDRPPRAVLLMRDDGDRWGKSEQHRRFKQAAAAAELPASASFYSLRHSHISRAIEAGMPLNLLAENCGTSLSMIQRNYAKVLASSRQQFVEQTSPRLRRVK